MKTFGLDGKTILVTGANGFLGKHICDELKKEGVNVIAADITNAIGAINLDITDREDIDNLDVVPYGIVNNAASCLYGSSMTQEQFGKVMNVNVVGTDNMLAKFSPIMPANGSIINVASIYGMLSPDFRIYSDPTWYNPSVYGASKAAIIQMTKYYAVRYAPLRINSVSPGGIFNKHDDMFVKAYSDRVPLKRMAEPIEIVNAIMFLLSPLSSYITGHNLAVTGGLEIL